MMSEDQPTTPPEGTEKGPLFIDPAEQDVADFLALMAFTLGKEPSEVFPLPDSPNASNQ